MEKRPDNSTSEAVGSLRRMYNLTKSEAEISIALAAGDGMHMIAKARQVSIGTLRAQLRSIFIKTNTRRQSQLVVLILKNGGDADKTLR